ncbi:hypothetical protein ILYODFUR_033537 [Ilyodon furcidens]|uniref:Uncharacterized protein n=1 Tax=Ilyodon furcidens TaxID=33524 RepID=A0ABV0UEQ8_9TELE
MILQQQAVVTTDKSEPAGINGIPFQNRFAPLQNENQEKNPSSKNNTRYENTLHTNQSSPKLPEKERPIRSRTLIMGNTAVNGIKNFCNRKNTEVMNGNGNMVSNISENILVFKEERQTLENLIIHFGAMDDVAKKNMYWRISFVC